MPKTPASTEPAVEASIPEASPQADAPIQFQEPVSAADQTAVVADTKEDLLISEDQMAALYREATRDNDQRDFTLKVLAARAQPDPEPSEPPPVAVRVAEQTRLEMEAGAKLVARNAEHVRPRYVQEEGRTVAVFRPGDYVPDPKKNQGHVQGRNL